MSTKKPKQSDDKERFRKTEADFEQPEGCSPWPTQASGDDKAAEAVPVTRFLGSQPRDVAL
jgi:hypothetical protein